MDIQQNAQGGWEAVTPGRPAVRIALSLLAAIATLGAIQSLVRGIPISIVLWLIIIALAVLGLRRYGIGSRVPIAAFTALAATPLSAVVTFVDARGRVRTVAVPAERAEAVRPLLPASA